MIDTTPKKGPVYYNCTLILDLHEYIKNKNKQQRSVAFVFTVTLEGTSSNTFKGFILLARPKDSDIGVGVWQDVSEGTQGMTCTSDTDATMNEQEGRCATGVDCGVRQITI